MTEILSKVWGAASTYKKVKGGEKKVLEIHCWEFDEEEENFRYVWKTLCAVDRLTTEEPPPIATGLTKCKECEVADAEAN